MITRDRLPRADRLLRRRWVSAVTLGWLLGFLAPLLAGAAVTTAAPGPQTVSLLAAGAVQGSVLGWCQARVLRSVLIGFPIKDWVLATAAGAVVAWSAGVLPLRYAETSARWPTAAQTPIVVAAALVVVFSVGSAQSFVLSRWTGRAALWVWGNAVAWIVGASAFLVIAENLWPTTQNTALSTVVGALGGLAMAGAVATVTGMFLRCVLAPGHVRNGRTVRRVDYAPRFVFDRSSIRVTE